MSSLLNQAGNFQAVPENWFVQKSPSSQSVAVAVEFRITAAWNGEGWDDWTQYEPQHITGFFYVIGKTGNVLDKTINNLVRCLGWDCSMETVHNSPAPYVLVQITTGFETYEGKERLKVQWLNHGDSQPGPQTISDDDLKTVSMQFGNLLRAAGSKAINEGVKPAAPQSGQGEPATTPGGGGQAGTGAPPHTADMDDDLPFD